MQSTRYEVMRTVTVDTCPEEGTCPLLKNTCVSLRVGEEKKSGWERKNRASKEGETSDNMQKDATYLKHMSTDNACHLYCCVT